MDESHTEDKGKKYGVHSDSSLGKVRNKQNKLVMRADSMTQRRAWLCLAWGLSGVLETSCTLLRVVVALGL